MSRLIDIEDMVFTGQYTEVNGEIYVRLSDYEACLDRQPIYDLEAVVRELEEHSKGFFPNADDDMFIKTITLPLAIEIVKRGGRNERTD